MHGLRVWNNVCVYRLCYEKTNTHFHTISTQKIKWKCKKSVHFTNVCKNYFSSINSINNIFSIIEFVNNLHISILFHSYSSHLIHVTFIRTQHTKKRRREEKKKWNIHRNPFGIFSCGVSGLTLTKVWYDDKEESERESVCTNTHKYWSILFSKTFFFLFHFLYFLFSSSNRIGSFSRHLLNRKKQKKKILNTQNQNFCLHLYNRKFP